MKNQVISLEVAKLSKEVGFRDHNCDTYYEEDTLYEVCPCICHTEDNECTCGHEAIIYDIVTENVLPAVTQSLLQKWLREKHDIHIVISVYRDMDHRDNYDLKIIKHVLIIPLINKKLKGLDILEDFPIKNSIFYTYEEALEEGLKEALLLINH